MPEMKDYLAGYDFNLPLKDALNDPTLSADRRALAAISMRQGLDDALFATHQLLEAFRTLETDHRLGIAAEQSDGATAIHEILIADGDDYQRRLYWMLLELPVGEAISDLIWLSELLHGRASMFRALSAAGARMPLIPGRPED